MAFVGAHPDQRPRDTKQVPEVGVDAISDHPNFAARTHRRKRAERCHVGINRREKRGDYRDAGCWSINVPYCNKGLS